MKDAVLLVTRMGLGTTAPGDATFGVEMLEKLLHSLEKRADRPRALCFYTEGVRCVVRGSPLVLGLRLLEGMGVRIVSCGTCLEQYGLSDAVAVGEVGGMDGIVALLAEAPKVVTV